MDSTIDAMTLISDLRERMRAELAKKQTWSRNSVLDIVDQLSIQILDGQSKRFYDAVWQRKRENAHKDAN